MPRGTDGRALIHYCCVASGHWDHRTEHGDTVTIQEGKWAYCPWNALEVDGHDWLTTGGLLREVLDSMREAPKRDAP